MQHNSIASVFLWRFFFLLPLLKAIVNSSPPKLVQTPMENVSNEAACHITALSLPLSFHCSIIFLYLFMWTSGNKSLSSIILFPADPADHSSGALIYIFNPLMSQASAHADRGERRPCGCIWRGFVIYTDDTMLKNTASRTPSVSLS